jgi:hypothetical protein
MFDWNIVQNDLIYGYQGSNYLIQGTNLTSNLFLYTIVLLTEFFFQITQYIGDTHNARTLIPMNTRT